MKIYQCSFRTIFKKLQHSILLQKKRIRKHLFYEIEKGSKRERETRGLKERKRVEKFSLSVGIITSLVREQKGSSGGVDV